MNKMQPGRINRWAKAIALTLAMPLFGLVIIGFWWRATFSWEKDYTPPLHWTFLYFLAMGLFTATPAPILWTIVVTIRKKSRHRIPADESP